MGIRRTESFFVFLIIFFPIVYDDVRSFFILDSLRDEECIGFTMVFDFFPRAALRRNKEK